MKNAYQIQQIIGNISNNLAEEPSLSQVCWLVCESLKELGLEDCSIYILDKDDNSLTQEAALGKATNAYKQLQSPHSLRVGQGIVGTAAQLQQEILVENTKLTPNYVLDESLGLSELSVPLIYNGEVIAVLDSESKEEAFYQPHHLLAFNLVASLVAPWVIKTSQVQSNMNRRKTDTKEVSKKYGLDYDEKQKLQAVAEKYLPLSYDFMTKADRAEYNKALHLFLKNFTKPDTLKYVPDLDAALSQYNDLGFKEFMCKRLKDILKLSMDELFLPSPKTQKYHFIIEQTYISPLPNHQMVADRLGMSYSTFARHLSKARTELVDHVWDKIHELISRFEAVNK